MLKYGFICEFDAEAGRARVDFKEDGFVSAWLPFLVPFAQDTKMSIPVAINEQVCVLCDTHVEDSVILGAVVNNTDKPYTGASKNKFGVNFSDGCKVEYDFATSILQVNTTGKVELSATTIDLTGAVKVTGALVITGAVTLQAGLSVAGPMTSEGVNLKTHTHSGVVPGGGVSGPPIL